MADGPYSIGNDDDLDYYSPGPRVPRHAVDGLPELTAAINRLADVLGSETTAAGERVSAAVEALAAYHADPEVESNPDPYDPMPFPVPLGLFRDWLDFVDKVVKPIVETDDHDSPAVREAMRLYRQMPPYYLCAALYMAAARVTPRRFDNDDADTWPDDLELVLAQLNNRWQVVQFVMAPLGRRWIIAVADQFAVTAATGDRWLPLPYPGDER